MKDHQRFDGINLALKIGYTVKIDHGVIQGMYGEDGEQREVISGNRIVIRGNNPHEDPLYATGESLDLLLQEASREFDPRPGQGYFLKGFSELDRYLTLTGEITAEYKENKVQIIAKGGFSEEPRVIVESDSFINAYTKLRTTLDEKAVDVFRDDLFKDL